MPTLYHYIHCPFCLRVRMALGYLKIPYNSEVLDYDDEERPTQLTGVKMLPIVSFEDYTSNESLEIIKYFDSENRLDTEATLAEYPQLETLLNKLGKNIHSLAMPYWIYTPEFNEKSRAYFQKKKELKRGPFKELVKNKESFLMPLQTDLDELEANLISYYHSEQLTLRDILIASHLWGLYVVPEFQFSPKIHQYLQRVKSTTFFEYHKDSWL